MLLLPVGGFRPDRHVLQLQSIPPQHLQVNMIKTPSCELRSILIFVIGSLRVFQGRGDYQFDGYVH